MKTLNVGDVQKPGRAYAEHPCLTVQRLKVEKLAALIIKAKEEADASRAAEQRKVEAIHAAIVAYADRALALAARAEKDGRFTRAGLLLKRALA